MGIFLDADMQLYKRLCPSVGPSAGPSVCPLIRLYMVIESKSGKTSVLDTFCVWFGAGVGIGVERPYPTIL